MAMAIVAIDMMTHSDSDQSLLTAFNMGAPYQEAVVLSIWRHEKGRLELSIVFTVNG